VLAPRRVHFPLQSQPFLRDFTKNNLVLTQSLNQVHSKRGLLYAARWRREEQAPRSPRAREATLGRGPSGISLFLFFSFVFSFFCLFFESF
jgi:hypothetical protein